MKEASVWTKKSLNPKLFSKKKLNNDIRLKLLKIAKDFYVSLEMPFQLQDIWLVGSNVSFNYESDSDLDVHLLTDFNLLNISDKMLTDFFQAKKAIWNEDHQIIIKGHEVELYVQDIKEKNVSDGIYSLGTNKWLKEPEYTEPKISKKLVLQKTKEVAKQIESLEKSLKEPSIMHKKAEKFKEDLLDMRKASLAKAGMFSLGNLVFKLLRNTGHIERLNDIINKTYDAIYTEKK